MDNEELITLVVVRRGEYGSYWLAACFQEGNEDAEEWALSVAYSEVDQVVAGTEDNADEYELGELYLTRDEIEEKFGEDGSAALAATDERPWEQKVAA